MRSGFPAIAAKEKALIKRAESREDETGDKFAGFSHYPEAADPIRLPKA
jgi:hypothetical protein